ncbi:MAG: 2-dehydropantoate 2-reductase [Puniceicoccales bacterium]|jgi:2-dehydropantoate 2-reductase|nr:2-dehydropantoate 2-reductase [Puniceicoccales bacterium]
MKILVVGAGAVGGYFGGRLLQAGRDVTFLVRPKRASELRQNGLVIKSPSGDATLPNPPTVLADKLDHPFELVLLSCKAYDLENAIESFRPAVGDKTMILPLLNGMRHLDALDNRFGAEKVLGGRCVISATLNEQREIVHFLPGHSIALGERSGEISERVKSVYSALAEAGFDTLASDRILSVMWEKWVMLASLAGCTTLMRASIGEIASAPGGSDFVLGLIEECCHIADLEGHPIAMPTMESTRARLTKHDSTLTASMFRDMEQHSRIEADHVIGDLLQRGEKHSVSHDSDSYARLRIVYANLKAYENRFLKTAK